MEGGREGGREEGRRGAQDGYSAKSTSSKLGCYYQILNARRQPKHAKMNPNSS